MGYGKVHTVCLTGSHAELLTVETSVTPCVSSQEKSRFQLSGLPDSAVAQSQTRIRSAIANSGFHLPDQIISVNFAPASVPTRGTAVDLPLAVSILSASGLVPAERLQKSFFFGELGLDGSVRPVSGVLPALLRASEAGLSTAVVPAENASEASLADGLELVSPGSLRQLVDWLRGRAEIPPPEPPGPSSPEALPDMADIRGQDFARRAVELAAAGRHNVFFVGPPGSGKTMLAERLPSILPPLSDQESLEVTCVHSLHPSSGTARDGLIRFAPFQAPHHSSTMQSLVGGGHTDIGPGALSLAHRGVLFLDEAPEWKREVLESIRQPVESGEVILHRAGAVMRYPSRVLLVLAANPCPCAALRPADCTCSATARRRYMNRLSKPLLDRVDLQLDVQPPKPSSILTDLVDVEDSAVVAERVLRARRAAKERWGSMGEPWTCNGEVPGNRLRATNLRLPGSTTRQLDHLLRKGRLSTRGYDRVLRLAWTIADLGGHDSPRPADVHEACEFRLGLKGATS
ncbi:YifB family Mg chelatase-like AAA ATPase [Salininema proteolyticum]|uniref:YifB family Mg chelatase-like AAA ATPase n=1 Tax=Salininema proteolyticum TaxID=1607685 RepID=A0ABV8U1G7_9ACTN